MDELHYNEILSNCNTERFIFRIKDLASISLSIESAVFKYKNDIITKSLPSNEHLFKMLSERYAFSFPSDHVCLLAYWKWNLDIFTLPINRYYANQIIWTHQWKSLFCSYFLFTTTIQTVLIFIKLHVVDSWTKRPTLCEHSV